MCACVSVCVWARGTVPVGAGYESGILVFKLSKVGQFQVMTRGAGCGHRSGQLKDRWKVLGVEELWRPGDGHCPWGHSSHPARAGENRHTKVRCLGPRRGRGEGELVMAFHSFIFIHSFRKYSSVAFAFTGNQADRSLSLDYPPSPRTTCRSLLSVLPGRERRALLEPWPQRLLRRHRGL